MHNLCASLLTVKQDSGFTTANCIEQRADSSGGMHCQNKTMRRKTMPGAPVQFHLEWTGERVPDGASRLFQRRGYRFLHAMRASHINWNCEMCVHYSRRKIRGFDVSRTKRKKNESNVAGVVSRPMHWTTITIDVDNPTWAITFSSYTASVLMSRHEMPDFRIWVFIWT